MATTVCAARARLSPPAAASGPAARLRPSNWCQPLRAAERSCRRRRHAAAAAAVGRRVVATSEHWYEEEEEFDALTDAMVQKTVLLVCPGGDDGSVDALRACLAPLKIAQGFASSEALDYAQRLWAGRDAAPFFLKIRKRGGLDAAGSSASGSGGDAAAAAGAAEVWAELLQQNWRVELDAGLGRAAHDSEALLLVSSPAATAQLLAAAGTPVDASSLPGGSVSALLVAGTEAGQPLDWQRLGKQLLFAGRLPSGGETIAAALEAAAVAPQS